MTYKLKTDNFEGPFDLLLYLVSNKRVDVSNVSINEIAQQYLSEIENMKSINLEVSSDFLFVASCLLEIKAANLLPDENEVEDEEIQQLSPNEARDLLIERLLEYKQFRDASDYLQQLFVKRSKMHERNFGPSPKHFTKSPDYLECVSLDVMGFICAGALARREQFLLESSHISPPVLSVQTHVQSIYYKLRNKRSLSFKDLFDGEQAMKNPRLVVVNFLAILELYKLSVVDIIQDVKTKHMQIEWAADANELDFNDDSLLNSIME